MTSGNAARRENAGRARGVGKGNRRKSKGAKAAKPRRDFALEQAAALARERERARAEQTRRAEERPVPSGPAVRVPRRTPELLPWEGDDQPDGYDRGIDRLMRERPHR